MRQRFLNILALVGFISFAGCAAEDVLPDDPSGDDELITFSAVQEGAATKAEISQSDSKVINWSAGDAITVYDGEGNSVRFGLTEGAGSARASFSGKISQTAESYLALSPYQGGTYTEDGKIEFVEMKAKQMAVAGSFDPEAALMVSRTEPGGTSMSFRNVVGYVKVTPQFDCDMISLISEDSSDLLAGTVSIDYNNGEPVVTVSDDGTNSVSISGDIVAGKTYYIAVLPGTLKSGFRLVFFAKDGKDAIKSTSKPLEVKRNTVINLGLVNTVALTQIPYVTFTANKKQTFMMFLADGITSLQYSVKNGPWLDIVSEKEALFGGSYGSLRIRGRCRYGTAKLKNEDDDNASGIYFNDENVDVACSGDIRTLVDYLNYDKERTGGGAQFSCLFSGCKNLISAPDLPALYITKNCYEYMFSGCSKLKSAPKLPASDVPKQAYQLMFANCVNLVSPPDMSSSTRMGYEACIGMFDGCSSLKSAPALPAMDLSDRCYYRMFANCTSLITAPEILPAIKLKESCYCLMFVGCTSLVSAPELPATTLDRWCYSYMFSGCTSLNSVKIKAKYSDYYSLQNWLNNVAQKGTIYKSYSFTLPSSAVPSGWSVVDYD